MCHRKLVWEKNKMDTRSVFGLLAGALWLFGYIPFTTAVYGFDLWQGPITPTQPSIATWVIFFLLDLIVLAGMYQKRTVNWQIIVATIGALWLATLSFFYGVSTWTTIDLVCLLGAVCGIGLWSWYKEANWGIVIGQTAMVIGVIPTVISAWGNPTRENLLAWSIGTLSCFFQLAATRSFTVAALTQPIGFFIIEASVMVVLLVR